MPTRKSRARSRSVARSRRSPRVAARSRSPPVRARSPKVKSPPARRRSRSPPKKAVRSPPARSRSPATSSPERKRKGGCPRKDGGCNKGSVTINLNRKSHQKGVVKRDYARSDSEPISMQNVETPEGPPIIRTIKKMSYKQQQAKQEQDVKAEKQAAEKMAATIEVDSPSKILWQFMNRA